VAGHIQINHSRIGHIHTPGDTEQHRRTTPNGHVHPEHSNHKFTLNTAINALRNVKNETITTRKILDYGGISGMVIGIIVAGACITFGCYTCFTRTPSERSLRRSHPPTQTQAAIRYTPVTAAKNQPNIAINLNQPQQAKSNQEREAPRQNDSIRRPNTTMVTDGGLLEDIRRDGFLREQQRMLQQAGRNAEDLARTRGQ
jgi:hypothetical protein